MNFDSELAVAYLNGLLLDFDNEEFVFFVHEGTPASKARARWSRKQQRFYTPTETQSAELSLAKQWASAVKNRPWHGNVALAAVFFRPNHQRIDADNLMKLVLDAGTKAGVWGDDSQVTRQTAVVEMDAARPRTVIAMAPVDGSLSRFRTVSLTCEVCGKTFERDRFRSHRLKLPMTCSDDCRFASVRALVRCARCGVEFKRNKAAQRYCSKSCAIAERHVRQNAQSQKPWPLCVGCGKRVTRREYIRCAPCAKATRKK